MLGKILSGVGNAVGGLVEGVGNLGADLYNYTPAGFASNLLGVDTNLFKMAGFGGNGKLGNGISVPSTDFIKQNYNKLLYPNSEPRQPAQDFGRPQGFLFSQALSGNMSPMQLQGISNMQPYQSTMTNPQYPEQEFITGNPMLYR